MIKERKKSKCIRNIGGGDIMIILNIIIQVVGGLGMFLYGMKMMSDSIQELAGYKLREMISRMTSNVFGAILTGALMTIVVQSSSVTTVMVVGFLDDFNRMDIGP